MRLTERFPWLLPLRKKQRKFFFYQQMRWDKNHYCRQRQAEVLPHLLYRFAAPLYNENTGFDRKYQENKVFNLKLAAKTLNGILIYPQEVFSFWQLVRKADSKIPYKDGLVEVNGKLQTMSGGGLCQMSNLLFWLFLHSPLQIVERHGHKIKHFPEVGVELIGGDATVAEGWLDLKVKNVSHYVYQLKLEFTEQEIIGSLHCNQPVDYSYRLWNEELQYEKDEQGIVQRVKVFRQRICKDGEAEKPEFLYQNICRIGYDLLPEKI